MDEGLSIWGSGMEITIRDLVSEIAELTGFNGGIRVHAVKS